MLFGWVLGEGYGVVGYFCVFYEGCCGIGCVVFYGMEEVDFGNDLLVWDYWIVVDLAEVEVVVIWGCVVYVGGIVVIG